MKIKKNEEKKCIKCGNIINSYYIPHYDICYKCREIEREKKINLYLRNLEEQLHFEENNIIIIAGGNGADNDMESFNDYYYTIMRMKGMLEILECKPPFTIVSNREVFNYAGNENNLQYITIKYNPDIEIENLWEMEEKEGIIKKVVINERDYILSQKWIKEWIFDDNLGKDDNDYRLMLTDGKKAIITGWLTLT